MGYRALGGWFGVGILLLAAPLAQADAAMDRARALLAQAPIIDGHNDLPSVIRSEADGHVEGYDLRHHTPSDTDIPRLQAGGVGGQFWSVYVPSSLSPLDAMRQQLEQIDIAHRVIERYPDAFMFAGSASDIDRAFASGRIASLLGIEGAHTIANSMGALRSYYRLGVRYATLTHFHTSDWADSATDEARHGGLSPFGIEVIHEMNRLGMLIDLSHVSPDTMRDALDSTQAPVIFSHSSARALTDHVRNVPDDVLQRMPENGGLVMVTFIPNYVNEARRLWDQGLSEQLAGVAGEEQREAIKAAYRRQHGAPPPGTLLDVADHIDYVARVAGHDHVGIGGDFYGQKGEDLVEGLEDVSMYPALIAELVRRGWTDENLMKLSRGNFMRVFREVEVVAARIDVTRDPSLRQFTP